MAKKKPASTAGGRSGIPDETKPSAASGKRPVTAAGRQATGKDTSAADARRRQNRIIGGVAIVVVAALAIVVGWSVISRPSGAATAGTGGAALAAQGSVVQGVGGQWTDVSPDTLAAMLQKKDFTFLNVKTPYIGEIEGTDLYIPYDQLADRASELPKDKAAPIVVYCRTGRESAVAAQTLIDLGYTDIVNLGGGMTAWTASGRTIVNKGRG